MTDAKVQTLPDLVGTEFVLWAREWRTVATTSSRVGSADGWLVLEEVPVTVVEQRNDVPGQYGSGPYIGLKARSQDGREFSRNWESYPDDAHTGATLTWYHTNRSEGAPYVDFVDAIEATSVFCRAIGGQYYDETGSFKVPVGAIICPRHGDTYLLDQVCESCTYDRSLVAMSIAVSYVGCPFCSAVRQAGDHDEHRRGLHIRWDHPEEFLAWSGSGHDPNDWTNSG